ncbi:hypothetical protein [Mycolicibacterium sp.]|uniref:hypothetical protein n=1 Tax=Mycolicibacterium sp. TaxID=2320850 RepID=UPI00355E4B86
MGRHALARTRRRRSPFALAAMIAPAAAFLAAGSGATPIAQDIVEPVVAQAEACCGMEIIAAGLTGAATLHKAASTGEPGQPLQALAASHWRVAADRAARVALPVGVAPESGLQVKTILAARAVSAAFPEISSIGGVRPDALRWHPNGLAIDVMIPNYSSAEGIALGNEIVAFVLKNAERFDLQDAIWRGVYFTPGGAKAGGYGHYDHVHITTKGGGYPTGSEIYLR